MKERNRNLDLIRVCGTLFIPGVHFFLYTGFYNEPIEGVDVFVALIIRNLTYCGVPLFMVLSGYLKKNKTASLAHYKTIFPILHSYLFSYVCIVIFNILYRKQHISIPNLFFDFLSFSNSYAWYIEMYIGLFFLMPILNCGWNALTTRRQKRFVLITILFTTIIPATVNYGTFQYGGVDIQQKILPSWWQGCYPIAYYYLGAYYRDYGPFPIDQPCKKQRQISGGLMLVVVSLISVMYTYSEHTQKAYHFMLDLYPSLFVFCLTATIFSFLLSFNISNDALGAILERISKKSLDIYLLSYISDAFWYPLLLGSFNISDIHTKILYMPVLVGLSFGSAWLMAEVKGFCLKLHFRLGITK